MKTNFVFGFGRIRVELERCEREAAEVHTGVLGFEVTVDFGRNGWV
jgi:hypothetical protein